MTLTKTTDYDRGHVAEQYQEAKRQPWRSRVETYSFTQAIGDVKGKRVVDAACGEGYFTRLVRRAGAAEMVGFDLSERMIDLARHQEAETALGIEYVVADARIPVPQRDFDLMIASWLLVYARDRQELAHMCEGIASWLRPGGRFVTFTTNPELYFMHPRPDYRKYGFEVRLADHAHDGAPIHFLLHLSESCLEIKNYFLPISAYETAFRDAGFHGFRVHGLKVSPDPEGNEDRAYWDAFMEQPPAIVIECLKD